MKSTKELNLNKLKESKNFTKSPEAWDEQIFYFLLVDRFANEENFPFYDYENDYENALQDEKSKEKWHKSGENWVGDTLNGLTKRGVSPFFKIAKTQSYQQAKLWIINS